ncbi:14286_t:CDS:2 [Funneliformis geosporum]|uniref:14989_t:CDS:1 n=1 Tax=Funneliformis geosporum TaxID=1117311 RepID=A0A9W4WSQ8_9GLOM|nr:14286_t:CDS:2 [Funneliformis geosporum]CAI2175878.1 14989_t:CDS:2 [Funneliformis geosporum]
MVSLCQAIIVSVLESFVFVTHTKAANRILEIEKEVKDDHGLLKEFTDIYALAKSMSIYHILFIVSQFFQLGLCADALYHQNTIQLIALSLFIFAGFAFSAIQVYQSTSLITTNGTIQEILIREGPLPKDAVPFEVAIIVVMFISSISFVYLSYKLYQEFALVVILEALSDLYLHIVLSLLTSIGMLIVGFLGVKSEKKVYMYLFMVGICAAEGYIIAKIVNVTENPNNKYRGTKNFVTFFLCVCLVLGVVTFIISFLCLRNFDKGLKYHLSRSTSLTSNKNGQNVLDENDREYNLETVNRTTQRWSLD